MMGKMKFAELARRANMVQAEEEKKPPDGEQDSQTKDILQQTYFIPTPTLNEAPKPSIQQSVPKKMSGFSRMGTYSKNPKSSSLDSETETPLLDLNSSDTKSTGISSLGTNEDDPKPKFNPFTSRMSGGRSNNGGGMKGQDYSARRAVIIDPFQNSNLRFKLKSRLRRIVEERLTVKQIFSRYVESSTLHGFLYTCSDTYLIRRIIWACLMILGALYFLLKLRSGLIEFFDYPFSTLSTIDYVDELSFPAISFCLINSFKEKELSNSGLSHLYKSGRFPLDVNWTDPGYDIPGKQFEKELEDISLTAEEIFEGCDWIKRDTAHPLVKPNICNVKNFTNYFNEKGQKCFTLNSGKKGHPLLKVTHEGLNYGYDALFDMKTSDTFISQPYTGLKVYIHSQHEPPVADSGFILAPGFRYFIKMKAHQTNNLEPPYGTECGEIELKYFNTYNQKACLLEKLTDFVGDQCGCRESFMPDNKLPICSLKETILCSFQAKENFTEYEARKGCPVDCEELYFRHQMTDARFLHNPPTGVEPDLLKNENARKNHSSSHLLKLVESLSPKELGEYVEDNLIQVIFFYGEIAKNIHHQEASFDFYQFLGDMGGEIGLMLGASLLTFVEFIDLFIFLIYHQILRLYKRKRIDEIFDDADEEDEENE